MFKKLVKNSLAVSILIGSSSLYAAESFTIVNALQGMCLDAKGYSASKGTQVMLYTCDGYDDQRWYFSDYYGNPVSLSNARYNYYYIRNVKSGLCLDVAGHSGWSNDNVKIWTCEAPSRDSDDQRWKMPHYPGDTGNILNGKRGRCLDVAGTSGGSRNNVQLWTCEGYSDQFWFINDIRYN